MPERARTRRTIARRSLLNLGLSLILLGSMGIASAMGVLDILPHAVLSPGHAVGLAMSAPRTAGEADQLPMRDMSPLADWKQPMLGEDQTHIAPRPTPPAVFQENHIGPTAWERARFDAQFDWRAFLTGIGIQIHAPEIASTPGPLRAGLPQLKD